MSWWIGSADASRSARPRRRNERAGGFTLLEVLVGFTVAAVMMTVLLQAFSEGLAGASRSASYAAAVLTAQSELDRVGNGGRISDGTEDRQVQGGYRVVTQVRRYGEAVAGDPSAFYAVPYEILVTVSWREGRQERTVSLRTLRLGSQPTQ